MCTIIAFFARILDLYGAGAGFGASLPVSHMPAIMKKQDWNSSLFHGPQPDRLRARTRLESGTGHSAGAARSPFVVHSILFNQKGNQNMKNFIRKIHLLAIQAQTAFRNIPESQRGALTIEWGQIIGIIVIVLLAVGALLQAFIPGFFQGILDKLGH